MPHGQQMQYAEKDVRVHMKALLNHQSTSTYSHIHLNSTTKRIYKIVYYIFMHSDRNLSFTFNYCKVEKSIASESAVS